jgi:hypothetical protein
MSWCRSWVDGVVGVIALVSTHCLAARRHLLLLGLGPRRLFASRCPGNKNHWAGHMRGHGLGLKYVF